MNVIRATQDRRVSTANLRALNDVILDVHRAGRDVVLAQFQSVALGLLQRVVSFDSAWWGNAAARPMEIHHLHLHNCDDSILQAYAPHIEHDFFRKALIAQPGVTINMSDLTSRARFVRSDLYQRVGKRYKIEWSLGTLLVEPLSSLQEFLTLWRHDGKRPFNETERQCKELLMPHLAEAHRMSRMREMLDGAKPQHTRWAVADERGYLREASPGFVHWLRENWPQWQGSQLPPSLLQAPCTASACKVPPSKLQVVRKGAFRYLVALEVSAMDSLSPRQLEIARRYARGETHATIAKALRLAPSTVRNHIALGYRKLSVNNKAELVARLRQMQA